MHVVSETEGRQEGSNYVGAVISAEASNVGAISLVQCAVGKCVNAL